MAHLTTHSTWHCPYSLPPQAYTRPAESSARQCQPPVEICVISMPLSAAILLGFFSSFLHEVLRLSAPQLFHSTTLKTPTQRMQIHGTGVPASTAMHRRRSEDTLWRACLPCPFSVHFCTENDLCMLNTSPKHTQALRGESFSVVGSGNKQATAAEEFMSITGARARELPGRSSPRPAPAHHCQWPLCTCCHTPAQHADGKLPHCVCHQGLFLHQASPHTARC